MEYYDREAPPNLTLSPLMRPLTMTEEAGQALIAFLYAFTGEMSLGSLGPHLPEEVPARKRR